MPTGGSRTALTYEERKKIYEGIKKGKSFRLIAIQIGRSNNGIFNEIKKNGGYANYDPEKAHQGALERNKEGNIKKAYHGKKIIDSYSELCEKTQNLEFQLEIIVDEIKELKNKLNEAK